MGREDCKVRYLKLQRRMFRRAERDLTKEEYQRLVEAAQAKGNVRLQLLLETICATGIRVSEVKYITVEAAQTGAAEIALKGKIRTILLPNRLCRKLLRYAKKQKITSGKIFLTRGGMGLSRKYIWAEMKNCTRRRRWSGQRCSRITCAACSPGHSIMFAMTLCAWRTCWATATSKRPAYI